MKPSPAITEAESVVMKVLWEQHPMTADEIVAALARSQEWQEATIKTLLNRLLKKGAIGARQEGRRYLYSPVLEREAWQTQEGSCMLARLFDGRVAPLVAHFSKHRKLSKADIAELKRLVEGLE
ncbi:MAG: BlaI/MecI/CopY family transcriptional regulator [Telluria sp.]